MGWEEAWQLGCGGSSSEGPEQSSVGPPAPRRWGYLDYLHLLLVAWGLGLLCWLTEVRLDLSCSGRDPGAAGSQWLPVWLPPLSSTGSLLPSGKGWCWEVAVFKYGWWLQCVSGQPFYVLSRTEKPQCGSWLPPHATQVAFRGSSDTGWCCI